MYSIRNQKPIDASLPLQTAAEFLPLRICVMFGVHAGSLQVGTAMSGWPGWK